MDGWYRQISKQFNELINLFQLKQSLFLQIMCYLVFLITKAAITDILNIHTPHVHNLAFSKRFLP